MLFKIIYASYKEEPISYNLIPQIENYNPSLIKYTVVSVYDIKIIEDFKTYFLIYLYSNEIEEWRWVPADSCKPM